MSPKITGALLALAALTLVVFAAGCIGTADQTAKVNDTVNVFYTLTLEDGTVHQTNVGKEPLSFILGSGQVVKGFDAAVVGMKPGETKIVTQTPDQAYGMQATTTHTPTFRFPLQRPTTTAPSPLGPPS